MSLLQEIDIFLTVIDKFINLLKKRAQNKQQLFKEFIEPLFNELQPIVDDYFILFRKSRDLVRKSHNNEQDLKKAVEEIRIARECLLSARIKVIALSTTAEKEIKDKKVVDFCQKIAGFFFGTQVYEGQKKTSHAGHLVELLDYVVEGKSAISANILEGKLDKEELKLDKEGLLTYINSTLKNLENSFVAIAQSYASLRIRCLS